MFLVRATVARAVTRRSASPPARAAAPAIAPQPTTLPVVPVTVLMAVAVVALGALWAGVRTDGGLAFFDPFAVTWLAAHRPDWAVAGAAVVSDVGSPTTMSALLVVVAAVVAWRRRSWGTAVAGGAGLGAVAGGDQLVKHLVARPRPPLALHAVPADGFSFPSGHATLSAGVVLLVLWITWPVGDPGRHRDSVLAIAPRWVSITGAALIVVAVAGSRVVLGVHYPSDVLAGWCVAVLADGGVVLLVVAVRCCRPPQRGTP